MSITAYTGLQGSGKSYGVVVNVLIPAIESGRRVFTNIPLREDAWNERYGACPEQFDIRDIQENPNWFTEVFEAGAICVIDELWRIWPSGLKANQVPMEHKSFLAEHRHMVGDDGYASEIVFVTQDLSQIAAFARTLVEYTYRSEKLSVVGANKRFRVDVFHGPVTGPSPPKSRRVRELYGTYDKRHFDLYISHTQSKSGDPGFEEKVDSRFNLLKGMGLKGRLFMIVCMLPVIIWGWGEVSSLFFGDDAVSETTTTGVPPSNTATAPRQLSRPAQRYSDVLIGRKVTIVWNNRYRGGIDYRLMAETDDGQVELSRQDLLKLNYQVRVINQCLLVLTLNGKDRVITCAKPKPVEQRQQADFAVSLPSFGKAESGDDKR